MIRAEVRVAGARLPAETAPVRNPARTAEVVGEVALGTAAHADAAVTAAREAFPAWAALPPSARAELCLAALDAWRPHVPELAELLTREQGHDGTGQPPGSVRAGPVPDRAHPGGGATIRELGTRDDPAGWDDGYFLRPAVVTDIDPGAEPVTGEQFGPIVPIIAFDRDDEAVRLANGTDYGLAASVWTADQAHGLAVARRLEAGTVFLNTHRAGASDVSMPFGGVKRSGIGRLHGVAALDACTEPQTVASYTDVSGFPGPPPLVAQAVSQVVPRTVPQKGE